LTNSPKLFFCTSVAQPAAGRSEFTGLPSKDMFCTLMVSPRLASNPIASLGELLDLVEFVLRSWPLGESCFAATVGLYHCVVYKKSRCHALDASCRRNRVNDGLVHPILRAFRLRGLLPGQ